jgi:branched-chain amino acid transport system substrate-binding protein
MMRKAPRLCVALLSGAILSIGVAACGGSDNDTTTAASGAAPAATTTAAGEAPAASSGKVDQATIDYGLKYTGGKAGKADASLPPVNVGFITQEGGAPSFPEQGHAADAVVQFINDELGGIAGRPLKLDKCNIQSEEDGQKCGAQMLAAKVDIVNFSLTVIGNASFYKAVVPKIPVINSVPATGPDSTTKGVYNLTGGGPGVHYAIAVDIKNLGSKNAALISVGNPGGKFTMEKIAIPALKLAGVNHGKVVYYPDDATTPDIVSALQAAGGSKADAIYFDPSTPAQCLSLYNAMKTLAIKIPVVTTPICNSDVFVGETGAGPEGWHIWGFGENPRVTDLPEVKTYVGIMDGYGESKWKNVGFAPSSVGDLLTITKLGNEIGADKLSPAAFNDAILAFRGPAFLVPGEQNCSAPFDQATQSVCGTNSVGSAFEDGKWKSLGGIATKLKSS